MFWDAVNALIITTTHIAVNDDCNKGRVREGEKDEEYGNEEYMNRCSRKHRVEEVSILITITIIIIVRDGEGVRAHLL